LKLLISGATGLVGSALLRRLAPTETSIRIFTRRPTAARGHLPAAVEVVEWDPARENAPAAAFEGVDAVIHLAGESVAGRWTAAKRRAIVDSRVLGTRGLVAGLRAAAAQPLTLVSASAIGYYGSCGEEEIQENHSPGSDFLARCSVQWENEAVAATELGHRVVRPRIGVVLAAEGGALAAMRPLFRLGLGGRLGSGRQWWSWIHIEDLVSLLLDAVSGGWEGAFHATAPSPVRQGDFARGFGAALGRPAILPAPAWALRLVLGGFASELLSSRRVLPTRARDAGFQWRFAKLEDALADLEGADRGNSVL
jgi:hypothetical protein